MNTATHVPNADTIPDTENMTSVIQLLDVQEHPIAKGDIIKKGFDRKAAAEQCLAYLHDLSQLPGCLRYTGDVINCAPDYNFSFLKTTLCWEQQNSW